MDLTQKDLSDLVEALPSHFDFYHLGNVQMSPASESVSRQVPDLEKLLDDLQSVAFVLRGDVKGVLIVAFEKGLDFSTYSELGNVLASRLATRLGAQSSLEVMISPPLELTKAQIAVLPRLGSMIAQRSYSLFDPVDQDKVATVKTFLLAGSGNEGLGNA